jgi:hypothetical protein
VKRRTWGSLFNGNPRLEREPASALDVCPGDDISRAIAREDARTDATAGDPDVRFLSEMPSIYDLRKREQQP